MSCDVFCHNHEVILIKGGIIMKRYAKFLMIFVFSVVTLTACSGDSESSGKVLKVAKDVELASMDQHIATDGLSFEVIAATIEGLYTLDADGNAIPAIAKSYDCI